MGTDVRKHTVPLGGEVPKRESQNQLSLSIRDAVPVANTTERTQLVVDLVAHGLTPSVTNPLYVHRADAPVGARLEVKDDGSTDGTIGWRPAGSTVRHAETTGPTPTFAVANAALWGLGAQTLDATASIDAPGAASGSGFLPSVVGLYSIDVWVRYTATISARHLVGIQVAGVEVARSVLTGDDRGSVSISGIRVGTTDLIEGIVYQASGAAQQVVSRTRVTLLKPL